MKKTALRFMVCSDLHYGGPDCREKQRFEEGLRQLYAYADGQEYSRVDAVYIVGDFATDGTLGQMKLVKESLDRGIRPGTVVNLSMASHEYQEPHGEEGARRFFAEVFGQPADTHRVIGGYHFISVSVTEDNHFRAPQIAFAERELEAARDGGAEKPIFFFQHPHLTGTVYGSIFWGERDLIPTLIHYPQIIDFSGHSHAPINDPRSIHQDYLTSVGTGTFSYFEMDEFDKPYGTFPPDAGCAAQMQIVEVYEDNSVLIRPWDVITGQFFHDGWLVERAWDPSSFAYTREKREREAPVLHFGPEAVLHAEQTGEGLEAVFDQALELDKGEVNDYLITVTDPEGRISRRYALWAPYYLMNRPDKMRYTFPPLGSGCWTVSVTARGFFGNRSENTLEARLVVGEG